MSQRYHDLNEKINISLNFTVTLTQLSNHNGFFGEQIENAINEFKSNIAEHLSLKLCNEYIHCDDIVNAVDFIQYHVNLKETRTEPIIDIKIEPMINYLSPYLPFKLLGISPRGTTFLLDIVSNMKGCGIESRDISTWLNDQIMPIFVPLSDLSDLLNSEFKKYNSGGDYDKELIDIFKDVYTRDFLETTDLSLLPYKCYEYMVKNHYDFFKLIKLGLAKSIKK